MARKTPGKSKTSKILRIAIYVATAALLLSGILIPLAARDNTIPPAVTPADTGVTTSAPSGPEPVAIVAVQGPMPPINPGGPVVEITLQNIGAEPVASLTAELKLERTFTFAFETPLAAGKNASANQTLIASAISDTATYPLTISGSLQSGNIFSYTKQVVISPPAR